MSTPTIGGLFFNKQNNTVFVTQYVYTLGDSLRHLHLNHYVDKTPHT